MMLRVKLLIGVCLATCVLPGGAAAACKADGNCYAFRRYIDGFICEAYRWPTNLSHTAYVTGSHTTLDQETIRLIAQLSFNTWESVCPPLPDITFSSGTTTNESTINVLSKVDFGIKYRNVPNHENALAISDIALVYRAQPWVIVSCITDIQDRPDRVFNTGASNSWDMQALLTHELGHWWRLQDVPTCPSETMYGIIGPNSTSARVLGQADVNGITYLYDYFVLVIGSFVASGGNGRVDLSWEDATPGSGGGFSIYRGDVCGGPYSFVMSVSRNDPNHTADSWHYYATDLTVQQSKPYFYMIVDGESMDYASAAPIGLPTPAPVGAPSGLSARQVPQADGSERVSLSWEAVAGATDGYEVYRRTGETISGCTDDVMHIGHASGPVFEDTSVPLGSEAYYRVRAKAGNDYSEYSDPAVVCVVDVGNFDDTVTLCPAADGADAMNVSLRFGDACGVSWFSGAPEVYALRTSQSSPAVWMLTGQVGVWSDTLRPAMVDVPSRNVVFDLRSVSGCGNLVLDVYVNGTMVLGGLTWNVKSYDGDSTTRGSVDRYDYDGIAAAVLASAPGCWDFDWSGGAGIGDFGGFLNPHYEGRHHVPRRLLTPNGGESYAPGETIPISWVAGVGDSARVTLRLIHESPVDTVIIAQELLDTGSHQWVVPTGIAADNDYRVEVVHTA